MGEPTAGEQQPAHSADATAPGVVGAHGERALVVIPTFNERENLPVIVGRLHVALPGIHVLVVDDSSPDGTGEVADGLAAEDSDGRVHVLHRTEKDGLGKAYLAGFAWGLDREYATIIEMDADGSHAPEQLHRLLDAVNQDPDARTALAQLRADHLALKQAIDRDFHEFSKLDERFHQTINSVVRNRFIAEFQKVISLIFHYHYMWDKTEEKHRNAAAIDEHLAIIDALEARGGPTSVREVAEILLPIVRRGEKDEQNDLDQLLFFTSVMISRRDLLFEATADADRATRRCFHHILRLAPEMPKEIINQRLHLMLLFALSAGASMESGKDGRRDLSSLWDRASAEHNLADIMAGMITAPVSAKTLAAAGAPASDQPDRGD